jgi:hypothetical protein
MRFDFSSERSDASMHRGLKSFLFTGLQHCGAAVHLSKLQKSNGSIIVFLIFFIK